MSGKKIRVTRTIKFTDEIPYNDEYYPDMTFTEALDFEKNSELEDIYEILGHESDDQVTIEAEVTALNGDGLTWNDIKDKTWDEMK